MMTKNELIMSKILKCTLLALAICLFHADCVNGRAVQEAPDGLTPTQSSGIGAIARSPQARAWADSVYNSLTERQRVAQLFVAHVNPDAGQAGKANVKFAVDAGVGGLLYTKGSLQSYAEINNYVQSIARVPLMITLDGEWGISMRVPGTPQFPCNMALGAITDDALLYDYGLEMARECQALGIQVNFAPVIDVNSNPANPVIGYRSFGEAPTRVGTLGVAYSMGLEDGGVLSVAKHFPGHGDTDADSHKALPTVHHSQQTLADVDLVPFRQYIASGMGGVMVGHLSVPALDASGRPASLSKPITTDLLREQMGFDGLVFTDALGMKGADGYGNTAVEAFKAGADVLLSPRALKTDIDAILKAVASGEIKAADVEARVKKILAYKYALGLADVGTVSYPAVKDVINSPSAQAVNQALCDAMVTAVHNRGGILPLSDLAHNKIAIVSIGAPKGNEFEEMCLRYAPAKTYDGLSLSSADLAELYKCNTVIAAVFKDTHAAKASLATLKDMPGLVTVMLVNPYKMAGFKSSLGSEQALVAAYEDLPLARQSAAKALFGGIDVTGRFPVNVDGVAKMGDGVDIDKTRLGFAMPSAVGMDDALVSRVDSIVNAAMASGAFPGAQVLVAKDGLVIIDGAYGHNTKGGKKVTNSTLYDLASVSKTVGTLPGVMKAYDLEMFDLDAPASAHIPGLKVPGKGDITPRMLLYHETGMPPSLNLFTTMMDPDTYDGKITVGKRDAKHTIKVEDGVWGHSSARMRSDITAKSKGPGFEHQAAEGIYVGQAAYDTIMQRIYDITPRSTRAYRYSCLNFCLLMDLEQRLTGQPHQQWVADSVWAPIGAYTFCYRPYEKYGHDRIAYTEQDNYLRRQHLNGHVHDELAAFSGGVQGNAGVFGTAYDIAKLCQTWLNGGTYGDAVVFSPETNQLFTTDKSPNSRRGLGFDKPDTSNSDNSPTIDECPGSVYGHTGYTGTAYWVDPDNQLVFIFLCNRVDPTRNNRAFRQSSWRGDIMRLIYNSLDD